MCMLVLNVTCGYLCDVCIAGADGFMRFWNPYDHPPATENHGSFREAYRNFLKILESPLSTVVFIIC